MNKLERIGKELYMYLLGAFIIGVAITVIIQLISHAVPKENHDIIVYAISQLMSLASMVCIYFFGTSKSSAEKTDMLMNSVPITTTTSTTIAPDIILATADPIIINWQVGSALPDGYDYVDETKQAIKKKVG